MNRVKVITDSCADLSSELIEKFDLDVVPLYVQVEGKSYLDGCEMTTEKLYSQIEKSNMLPKTAAPSSGDYYEYFSKWINAGYDVLYVGLSSKLSAAFQAARIAAEEFDEERIKLLDTQSLSTGIGLLALKASELAKEGKSLDEIYQKVSALVPKVRVSFVIDTLKYLHMGGRCTAVQLLASNVLRIHPQIIVKDGGMIVGAKFRGKRTSYLDQFFKEAVGDGSHIDRQRAFITHSASSAEECLEYKNRLEQLGVSEVYITQAGTVISSHCGPGTIGVLYIEK